MRSLAWSGVAGPVLRLGLILILGTLQPGYSQVHGFISQLGAQGAPFAALMNYVGISLVGALLAVFSAALYHATKPGAFVLAGAALLALSGLTFIAVGLLPCDPGCSLAAPSLRMRLHVLTGLIAMATQTLAPLAFGLGVFGRAGSRRYAAISLVCGAIALVALASMLAAGFQSPVAGLLEKTEQVATDLWVLVSAAHVLRLSPSSPLPDVL